MFLCVWGWNISVAGVALKSWQPEGRDWVEGYRWVWVLLNSEISFTAIAQQVTMEMKVYQTLSLSHWWIWPTRLTDSNRKAKQQKKKHKYWRMLGITAGNLQWYNWDQLSWVPVKTETRTESSLSQERNQKRFSLNQDQDQKTSSFSQHWDQKRVESDLRPIPENGQDIGQKRLESASERETRRGQSLSQDWDKKRIKFKSRLETRRGSSLSQDWD